MWSHDVVSTSILLAGDLKIGQYRTCILTRLVSYPSTWNWFPVKIPPRVMVITQLWGTLLGCFISYAVMTTIVDNQRDILLDPVGTNVWSTLPSHLCLTKPRRPMLNTFPFLGGQTVQSLNSAAVTWSLAGQLYGRGGPYVWVPVGLVIFPSPFYI